MKMKNRTHIEGLLYQHTLEMKVTGPKSKAPGTQYITGNVEIATDNALTNIISVHFSYVTELTANKQKNRTYDVLSKIINNEYKSCMADGAENAAMLAINSAVGLNEWYGEDGELISRKRNEGGFISKVNSLNETEAARNTFELDMIITSAVRQEGDEERGTTDRVVVNGYTFDFRGALLPVEIYARDPDAMNYYEDLGASPAEPVFTEVRGVQISSVVKRPVTRESAFGGSVVDEVTSTRREFVITWGKPEPYLWDDESTITVNDFKSKIAEREVYLASIKQRQDEYKASQAAPANAFASTSASASNTTFNF